jgi:hypothetical protein
MDTKDDPRVELLQQAKVSTDSSPGAHEVLGVHIGQYKFRRLHREGGFEVVNRAGPLRPIKWLAALFVVLFTVGCPKSGQYKTYWGDVHGHTGISDGTGSIDDYFHYARNVSKLDFVIVTDHDFGNAAPWNMPRDTWQLTQEKADEYTLPGGFVAIAGYEWTSQPKYWTPQEPLFDGPTRYYNHKNVYFPSRVDYLFSAKDAAFNSPNLLAREVLKHNGLIHNNHPDPGLEGRDQFDYDRSYDAVIVNTELLPDTLRYQGKTYSINGETTVQEFLNKGGRTGFVRGTDTHEGKPAARTAVLAGELTRPAILDALRCRRNYVISHARILLDFRINGHCMGEEIETKDKPRLSVSVKGTDTIKEVAIVRDGVIAVSFFPKGRDCQFEYVDESFTDGSYYYVRVTQVDTDEYGNPSCAWSSPIWVKHKP